MAEFRAAMAEQYQEIKPQLDQKLAELREEAEKLTQAVAKKKKDWADPAYEKLKQKWQEFKAEIGGGEEWFDKAEKLFQESQSLPADQREAKLNEAIGLYRKVYENNPQHPHLAGTSLMMIGLCYDWMGKRAEEIAALELAVEKFPDRSPAAYYYLGSAYRQVGQKEKASEAFKTCISQCDSKAGFPYTAAMQELRGMGASGYDGKSALLSNQRPKLWEIGAANGQCNEFDTDPRDDAEVVSYEVGQDWKQFPAGLGTDIGKQRSTIEIHFIGAVPQENELQVVWSAGGSESVEQFQVELDGVFVAKSEARKGASPPVWQAERFTLPAQPEGPHTLRLKHLSGDGLELDYLALEGVAKPNVAAEEEKIPGSTVDFRIAPKKGSGEIGDDQIKQYLETLSSQGPKPADSQTNYQWFPVKEGKDTIFTKDLISGEYQRIQYVLLHTQKHKVMLHTEGWGVRIAALARDPFKHPKIDLQLDARGADLMGRLSEANIDECLAVLVDGEIVSIPMIKSKVQYHVGIFGSFTEDEASRMAKAIWIGMPSTMRHEKNQTRFQPEEEIVLRYHLPDGPMDGLDLDTGKIFELPKKNELTDELQQNLLWLGDRGIDVINSGVPTQGLVGFNIITFPVPDEMWNDLKAQELLSQTVWGEAGTATISCISGMPKTYVFQTREGGIGILQIIGFADQGKDLKIRYKIVQSSLVSKDAQNKHVENDVPEM